MIVFLTLAYVGVLFGLKAAGVIRWNLSWKLSPIAWMLLLLVGLFIPMQWGAPSGPVGVFRFVIEIVPAVSGQVIEVPIEPLKEVKQGMVLFQIDPLPFEAEVRRLEAALDDAKQQPDLLASAVTTAEAAVEKAAAELENAKSDLARTQQLADQDAISGEQLDRDTRTATVADRTLAAARAQLADAKLKQSAVTSNGENTAVAQAQDQLERAKYDLEHTKVTAPTDGIVQQLALRPGTRVAAIPLSSGLLFVDSQRTRIAMAVNQNQLRYVKPGQRAEVVLKYLPGMTLAAEVEGIALVTSGGQVKASGVLENLSPKETYAEPYQVVLTITDERVKQSDLPGGAVGTAAIYTEHATFSHVVRRVMLRMQAWLNYIH